MADLSSTAPPAQKVIGGVVDFGRGCLLRDDINCPVYELISEVGVVFDPFGIEAVVVFAAGNVDAPPQARLTQVHIELREVLTVVFLQPLLFKLVEFRFIG